MAYSFFQDLIVPNAVNRYQIEEPKEQSASSSDTGELLIVDLIVKCLNEYDISVSKVFITFLRYV